MCALTRSLGHPIQGWHHPGIFGAVTGSALFRKLTGVSGFGSFHPQGWVLVQELGAGTGTVCCSPALWRVLGCDQRDAQQGLGVFTP